MKFLQTSIDIFISLNNLIKNEIIFNIKHLNDN